MYSIPRRFVLFCSAALSLALLGGSTLHGQTGTIDGAVTDAQKHPVAGATVWLDDQEQGRSQSATSDQAGHFHFAVAAPGFYMIRAKKSGYAEASHGPVALQQGEKISMNLQLAEDKSSTTAKIAAPALEYSDEPKFTVAGVSDPSNVGGHGSNVTLPTKEALAKDTALLANEPGGAGNGPTSLRKPSELPKVSPEDFAQNLEAGRALLDEGRAKEA